MPKGIYKRTEEHKRKLRKNHKGMLGKFHSQETKRKIGLANSIALKGRKQSEEIKRKIGKNAIKVWLGRHHSEETKRKMSEIRKRKPTSGMLGKKHSEETKQKIRQSTFKYIKKIIDILYPRIGKNEKQILDKLENELNYKIIRQYECKGYFIDGYIPEIRLVIEVDERPKILEKDLEREKIIKEELNCEFLRIKDYD